MADKKHHQSAIPSKLTELNIDMEGDVPVDYMHCGCIGLTKMIMQMLCQKPNNKAGSDQRLLPSVVNKMSTKFEKIGKHFTPREFNRKPRTLNELGWFKATEFRHILLYTGVVVLKIFLSKKTYINFLQLHAAITIL